MLMTQIVCCNNDVICAVFFLPYKALSVRSVKVFPFCVMSEKEFSPLTCLTEFYSCANNSLYQKKHSY